MDTPETIFYDGYCGLCHRTVNFVMPRDPNGEKFRFAPLQGEAIKQALTQEQRDNLPDSVVVLRRDGRLLVKSTAIMHILKRLGGGWAVLGTIGSLIPRPIRDLGYDGVASVRHKLFKKPSDACPMMPPELRARFLM